MASSFVLLEILACGSGQADVAAAVAFGAALSVSCARIVIPNVPCKTPELMCTVWYGEDREY